MSREIERSDLHRVEFHGGKRSWCRADERKRCRRILRYDLLGFYDRFGGEVYDLRNIRM